MLQEHTLGKQLQTRPNAEHLLLLFAAHGPLFTNPGPLLGALGPLLGRSWAALGPLLAALGRSGGALGRSWAPLGRSWAALRTTCPNHLKIDAKNDRFGPAKACQNDPQIDLQIHQKSIQKTIRKKN